MGDRPVGSARRLRRMPVPFAFTFHVRVTFPHGITFRVLVPMVALNMGRSAMNGKGYSVFALGVQLIKVQVAVAKVHL